MKRQIVIGLIILLVTILAAVSQTKTTSKAEVLQSFRPRSILIKQFLEKCEENNINLLLLEDKMGNKSKMTRFTAYKTSLIYISRYGKKRLTYIFNFKDDTLFTVKSY